MPGINQTPWDGNSSGPSPDDHARPPKIVDSFRPSAEDLQTLLNAGRGNPPHAARSYTTLKNLHDTIDEMERYVVDVLTEEGYEVSVEDPDTYLEVVGDIVEVIGYGPDHHAYPRARKLAWVANIAALFLEVHRLICPAATASRIMLTQADTQPRDPATEDATPEDIDRFVDRRRRN